MRERLILFTADQLALRDLCTFALRHLEVEASAAHRALQILQQAVFHVVSPGPPAKMLLLHIFPLLVNRLGITRER